MIVAAEFMMHSKEELAGVFHTFLQNKTLNLLIFNENKA